jgi:hypothetical protein
MPKTNRGPQMEWRKHLRAVNHFIGGQTAESSFAAAAAEVRNRVQHGTDSDQVFVESLPLELGELDCCVIDDDLLQRGTHGG